MSSMNIFYLLLVPVQSEEHEGAGIEHEPSTQKVTDYYQWYVW